MPTSENVLLGDSTYLLFRLAANSHKQLNFQLEALGINAIEYWVLLVLEHHGMLTPKEISDVLTFSANQTISNLRTMGLVDVLGLSIYITPRGLHVLGAARSRVDLATVTPESKHYRGSMREVYQTFTFPLSHQLHLTAES